MLLKQAWARQSALSGTVAPMPPLHATGRWACRGAAPCRGSLLRSEAALALDSKFAVHRHPCWSHMDPAGVTLNVDRLVHVAQASSRWRQPAGLPPGVRRG